MKDEAAEAARAARAAAQHLRALERAGVRSIRRPPPVPEAALPGPEAVPGRDPKAAPPAVAVPVDVSEPFRSPPLSTAQKIEALQAIAREVASCRKCPILARGRQHTVPGEGNPDARIVFVGEAPGFDEDQQGRPFVGAAGQLLTRIIEACRLKREEVFIGNVLKCRPPNNRTPLPDEVANCEPYLHRQMEIIRPEAIVALGAVAARCLLRTAEPVGRLRGRLHQYRGRKVVCTYHPSYLLHNPARSEKQKVWDDMRRLMREFGVRL